MKLPMKYTELKDFEQQNHLFSITKKYLVEWLEKSYYDDPQKFREEYGAEFSRVLQKYRFEREGISFSRSYGYEPPLDYISVSIRIYDEEDDYIAEYRAFFDLELKVMDDKMKV